ncbi:MAG: N-acetylmuramoyl-L-alanine amidase [Clostridia bacterium]|jgi:N-acetylmuramoyl-L-alanine amidase|nr:N-acetylmuramoyl-L-alanine amidase [Clostridia bacterium]MCI2000750.1 N-acetylmuramoyl-L-alanine amidase [Clostridia bacterium]MCI2015458.1 N-acetylmuramoyl-L-alanine amidase [Clostridia bacterium]
MRKKVGIIIFTAVFVLGLANIGYKQMATKTAFMPLDKKIVVIDAGHGGWDPGKTGLKGENEKDINLAIAKKLTMLLESGGAVVYTVRNDDEALGNSKSEDMRGRKNIVDTSGADILVSIHQNSFPSEEIKGAQVFYHGSSDEGKELAGFIQKKLSEILDNSNERVEKSNESYYILRKVDIPAVIVECGFLSNPDEEIKLNSNEYQNKTAWAIYCGIVDYFDSDKGV